MVAAGQTPPGNGGPGRWAVKVAMALHSRHVQHRYVPGDKIKTANEKDHMTRSRLPQFHCVELQSTRTGTKRRQCKHWQGVGLHHGMRRRKPHMRPLQGTEVIEYDWTPQSAKFIRRCAVSTLHSCVSSCTHATPLC